MAEPRFGRQRIEADVEGVCEDTRGSLTIEPETHQARTSPLPAKTAEGERSIVVSAAHSQTATLAVDSYEGYDDEVEPARRGPSSTAVRHGDAEYPAARAYGEGMEPQPVVPAVGDHRNEKPDPAASCRSHERRRIDLAIEGQVNRDAGAGFECG